MNKIRLSYSLISQWKRKQYEECVKTYLHVDEREPTDAMIRGINFDRMAKDIALREQRLPDELGSAKLSSPAIVSEKVIFPYTDTIDLSAEFDIRTNDEIIELKCSEVMDSADYLNTLQLPFYLFIADKLNLSASVGKLYRYDPSRHEYDMSILYPSERLYREVSSEILTCANEIATYFKSEGVI